jgi:hypothetical protein
MLAVGLVTLGAYVGGYFWSAKRTGLLLSRVPVVEREFHYEWQIHLFKPMAALESRIRQTPVQLESEEAVWNVIP